MWIRRLWVGCLLAGRGIAVVVDDIGRLAVACDDARRLIAEQRELEASRRAKLEAAELQAVERDRLWRAALPSGIPGGHDSSGFDACRGVPPGRA
jgi:hypothetical protein